MNPMTYAGLSVSAKKENTTSVKNLLNRVELMTGITIEELRSKDRRRDLTDMRKIISYHCNKVLGMRTSGIGLILNRDRATMIYSVKLCEQLMDSDEAFRCKFNEILDPLKNDNLIELKSNELTVADMI